MMPPTTSASGRLLQKPSRTRSMLMSSIITTNRNSTPCTGLRAVITSMPEASNTAAKAKKSQVSNIVIGYPLAVAGVFGPVAGDALLVAVAHREQHGLGVVEIPPLLAVVLEDARLDDRVHRAGLFAETAEDA